MHKILSPHKRGILQTTKYIQQAITECSQAGGGTVTLTAGQYHSGTLELLSGVTLELKEGAILFGSPSIEDYSENKSIFIDAVGHKRGKAFIFAHGARNIRICGRGRIHGRGEAFTKERAGYLERPFLIRIVNCTDVTIKDITLSNSAAWTLHILNSSRVKVQKTSITSRSNDNNDGIDIDASKDVLVEDCYVDTSDDGICLKTTSGASCENITVRRCTIFSDWAGFKIGTESVGDFRNIIVEDSFFYDVQGCAIKIVPADGANIQEVLLQRLHLSQCTGPIFIANSSRLREYFGVQRKQAGIISDITLREIRGDIIDARTREYLGKPWGNARGGIAITGLSDNNIQNLTIENCEFRMPGGVVEGITTPVPELTDQYPEFHLLGTLPAYGMYLRHIHGLEQQGVKFHKVSPDIRKPIVLENVIVQK